MRRRGCSHDLAVRVDYCGVCHTDLHAVRGHDGEAGRPLVPGHEFTGVVTEAGPAVTRFSVGDVVAVGNIVDSCGDCTMCRAGQENFCHTFPALTYGGADRHDGSATLGGYSREYVVREGFAYALPAGLDPAAAAPLLCAGVTVWEPLHSSGVGPGTRVAVAGLGGLGHLAVKFAVALGAETSVVSRSSDKADDACRLGARGLVVSTDPEQMADARDRFDVVIDTISAPHDLGPYLRLVAMDGTLSFVGHPRPRHRGDHGPARGPQEAQLRGQRRQARDCGHAGLLRRARDHRRHRTARLVTGERGLDRLGRNDVRYRFVLDMSDLD